MEDLREGIGNITENNRRIFSGKGEKAG